MLGASSILIWRLPESRPVAWCFALNSVLFGSWFSRIAEIRLDLGLSEGQLGLALLGLPTGAVLMLPFAGFLIDRLGGRRVMLGGALGCASALVLPGIAWDAASLFLALAILGIGNGAMDVGMNAVAARIESELGRPVMSAFHAMFSLGGVVGGILGSLAAGIAVPPAIQFAVIGLAALPLLLARYPNDRPPGRQARSAIIAFPAGRWGLAAIAFACLYAEAAPADWSAVYLRDTLGAAEASVGLGFAGFMAGMTLARLAGDALRRRLGMPRLFRFGGTIAAMGFALALVTDVPAVAILGFACLGFGLGGVVPLVFLLAAQGENPGLGLAGVTTVGYLGFLAAPALTGLVAEAVGLRLALLPIVFIAIVIATLAASHVRSRTGPGLWLRARSPG